MSEHIEDEALVLGLERRVARRRQKEKLLWVWLAAAGAALSVILLVVVLLAAVQQSPLVGTVAIPMRVDGEELLAARRDGTYQSKFAGRCVVISGHCSVYLPIGMSGERFIWAGSLQIGKTLNEGLSFRVYDNPGFIGKAFNGGPVYYMTLRGRLNEAGDSLGECQVVRFELVR